MKALYYIRYFFYIALNWNPRLAIFTIYHEIRGEKKYRINTAVIDDLKTLTIKGKNRQFAEIYQGAGYYLLEKVFQTLSALKAPLSLTDFGSGKGRVMVVAAHFGFTRITGIEFAGELCIEARQNCKIISQLYPGTEWNVIHSDAVHYKVPAEETVFFFFNPFKEQVFKIVVQNIITAMKNRPGSIYIVYINPQHKDVLFKNGFRLIHAIRKMEFVEACIFERKNL